MNVQTALIHAQPLDARRRPLQRPKLIGTQPRDGLPHRIAGTFAVDPEKEMPYFVRVFADQGRGFDFEIQSAPPERMRKLKTFSFVQDLTVQPRTP